MSRAGPYPPGSAHGPGRPFHLRNGMDQDPISAHGMAVEMLTAYRLAMYQRDKVVRTAYDAGLTKNEIHIHSGIARSTIDRILAGRPDE